MKTLNRLLVAACATGAIQVASALNYSSTDLLLVFRKDGVKDVEFDLGSVSNYLAVAAGTRVPVSYDTNLVQTSFGGLSGVRFGVVGTTSQVDPLPRVWLSDATLYSPPAEVTFSKFSQLTAKIDNVGINAAIYTATNSAPYTVATSASSSYDYIVTYGTFSAVSTLAGDAPTAVGGLSPVPVDAVNPSTIALYQVQASTSSPKPAALLVGAFTLDVSGGLVFTAGSLPPLGSTHIVGVDEDAVNGAATISFQTTGGFNYQLLYSTSPTGGWAPVPGAGIAYGDGNVQSLIDYNALDPVRFYRVQTTY